MKRIVYLCLALCFGASINYAQNTTAMEKELTNKEGLACKLTGPELLKRKSMLQKEIFAQVLKSEEKDDGYTFYFKDDEDFLLTMMDYVLAEKKCCPFLTYQLSIQPNGEGISLSVSGPPPAKDMIRMLVNKQED